MKNNIKISVIIPIYNSEKYLSRCIESILSQKLTEIEILLINDGSTDNSEIICEKYFFDSRVRYFKHENKGCSYSRNFGIKNSNGKYIAFVDSDDYLNDDMYLKLYSKMENEGIDYLVCGINYQYLDRNKEVLLNIKKNYLSSAMLLESPVNKLFKKNIIKKNKISFPDDCHSGEDLNFCFKYVVNCKKYGYINESLYIYNLHGENSVYKIEKRLEIFKSFDDLYKYLQENNYFKNKKIKKNFRKYFLKCCIWIPLIFFKKNKLKKNDVKYFELENELKKREYIKKIDFLIYKIIKFLLQCYK